MIIEYFVKPTTLTEDEFKSQLYFYNWDLIINQVEYDVYSMEKCHHRQGGSGDNNLWCIKHDDQIKAENFHPYQGNIFDSLWGIQIVCEPIFRKGTVKNSFTCYITRNGKPFYKIYGNTFSYLHNQALHIVHKLNDFHIPFHFRNWENEIINRKVWWCEKYPAIIVRYVPSRGCVVIIPDDKEMVKNFDISQQKQFLKTEEIHFPASRWEKEDFEIDFLEEREIMTDLFNSNIDWFRN